MKKIIVSAIMLFMLSVGSAFALPWTQTLAQLSVDSFNFVEGFNVGGQLFSAASPANGINFDGIGNFTDPAWHGDRPNANYVRAWGPDQNFLFWDIALDGATYQDNPMGASIYWFFYNVTGPLTAPPRPEDCLGILTYYTRYDPRISAPNSWQMWSSVWANDFGTIPNMYDDTMATLPPDIFAEARGEWTVPVDPSAPVPEPSTVILLASGLLSLAVFAKRRQKQAI